MAVAEVEGGIFISAFSADATRSIVRVFNPTGSAVRFAVYVVNDRPQDSGGTGTGQCTRRSNSGTLGCLAGGGLAEPGIQAQAGLTNNIRHFNRGSMLYLAVNGGVADVIGEQGLVALPRHPSRPPRHMYAVHGREAVKLTLFRLIFADVHMP